MKRPEVELTYFEALVKLAENDLRARKMRSVKVHVAVSVYVQLSPQLKMAFVSRNKVLAKELLNYIITNVHQVADNLDIQMYSRMS